MGHLHKYANPVYALGSCKTKRSIKMSVYNLSIVFGPTLFGQPYPGQNGMQTNGAPVMADAGHQNKVSMGLVQCRNAWKTKILLRRPSRRSSNTTQTFLSTKVKKPESSLLRPLLSLPYFRIFSSDYLFCFRASSTESHCICLFSYVLPPPSV